MSKFKKSVGSGLDQVLLAKLPLPEADWTAAVYDIQAFALRKSYANVIVPHCGGCEIRFITQGEITYSGVSIMQVPGQCLFTKRQYLHQCNEQDLKELVSKYGWVMTQTPAKAAIIPSGCFVGMTASDDTFGVRWTIASDPGDTARVKATLKGLVTSYAEYSTDPVHTNFLSFLEAE